MSKNPFDNFVESIERYSNYEYHICLNCIIPLIENWGVNLMGSNVLDLGCGGGGYSIAITEYGANCFGIDKKLENIKFAEGFANKKNLEVEFLHGDILELRDFDKKFDLILLLEVLEHLIRTDKIEIVLLWCKDHLSNSGKVFISFPPWYNPFAGHQAGWPQIRFMPWYHLYPTQFKKLLAPTQYQRYLEFSRELNRLTITEFEEIVTKVGLSIHYRTLYHIRPEYYWRYGIPAVKSSEFLSRFRLIKEITTTGAYYLLSNQF